MKIKTNKGFSLLELIVVMFLVGLMAALVPPVLTDTINNLKFRTAAKNITSSLKYAKSQAIGLKIPVTFFLNTQDNMFWIFLHKKGMSKTINKIPTDKSEIKYFSPQVEIVAKKKFDTRADKNKLIKKEEKKKEKKHFEELKLGDDASLVSDSLFSINFYPNGVSSGGKLLVKQTNENDSEGKNRYFEITVDIFTSRVSYKEFPFAS